MNEFETKVVERLASIEAKAEQYITWKMVVGGMIIGASALVGYGEWQMRRLSNSVEDKLAGIESTISKRINEGFKQNDESFAKITDAVSAANLIPSNSVYGALQAQASGQWISTSIDRLNPKDSKILYYSPDSSTKFSDEWLAALEKVVTEAPADDPIEYSIDELYVKRADGTFEKAFEPKK